jgi:uncharacterized protein (TIGR02646 family)
MRSVVLADAPEVLYAPDSPGRKEIEKAIAFYEDPKNFDGSFPFKAYKEKAVTGILQRAFAGKCAYCESKYEATQPMDVEHYRPKGGYVNHEGRLTKPGYYWLAAVWANLLPSCIDCNRSREQEVEGVRRSVGKANRFPIANERSRARRPGEEKREHRLLLHPCLDEPEEHLVFNADGSIDPARDRRGRLSPKGKASIEVYALDRKGLKDSRARRLRELEVLMTHIERVAYLLEQDPDDERLVALLKDFRKDLEAFADPDRQYSLMVRQAIDRFEDRLIG